MKYICSLILVDDMARSRYLYETLLGQEVETDFGENLSFRGGFALHLRSHFETLLEKAPAPAGGNRFELCFEEDRIEEAYETLKAAGYAFAHPLREQPWRQRVFRFYDPDGHLIEVGESMAHTAYRLFREGLPLKRIAAITYLSLPDVEAAIARYRAPAEPQEGEPV